MRRLRSASLFCLIGLLVPVLSSAEVVGNITHLGGILHATSKDGTNRMLSIKSEIIEGDTLKTENNTFARIRFVDGGDVVLRPNTVFKVNAYSYRPVETAEHPDKIRFDLLKGGVRSKTGKAGKRNPASFEMKTVVAILGVRGTETGVLLCNNDCDDIQTTSGEKPQNGLYTDTTQGTTTLTNKGGSIDVPAGSSSYVKNSKTAPILVLGGVQVTMPSSFNSPSGRLGVDASGSNACSVE